VVKDVLVPTKFVPAALLYHMYVFGETNPDAVNVAVLPQFMVAAAAVGAAMFVFTVIGTATI